MVFFDFKAAFPSVNHEFMWAVLEHIGTSPHFLNSFKCVYRGNFQQVVLRGRRSKLFPLNSGIRQGCPLSPLLFAVVIDIFLRMLHRTHLNMTMRAFADDIGMIVRNIASLAAIHLDFLDFAKNLAYT